MTATTLTTNEPETYPSLPISSAEAIELVRGADETTPIIVDFDETLFLRNSTEAYLNSVYPRPAGALLLFGLKAIKPWRLLPSQLRRDEISKDWCLVLMATLLFPWTLLVWRYRARDLAKAFWNQSLVQAIAANPSATVVVATLGFDFIVQPLLKHLPAPLKEKVDSQNTVACRFWQGPIDRAKGKLAMVREALGEAAVEQAIAITDSNHDRPLLDAVMAPCWVVWPEAKYIPAMADVYLPLFYSEKVKNPNKAHFLKRVVMGHWAFLAIALSFLSPHPWLNATSLFLLVVSYWCIYEIGYQENDAVGEKYEKQPILSTNYSRYKSRINLHTATPWYWASAIALPALLMLEIAKVEGALGEAWVAVSNEGPSLLISDMALWLWFLVAVRLSFWAYNQFNEEARIWIYPLLQVQKLFGFTLLVGTNAIGAILLMALIISRWLHYAIYRCGGDRWRFPLNLCCLLLFVMMYVAVAVGSRSAADILTLQAAAATAYCLLRSLKAIRELKPRIALVGQLPPQQTQQRQRNTPPLSFGSAHSDSGSEDTSLRCAPRKAPAHSSVSPVYSQPLSSQSSQ